MSLNFHHWRLPRFCVGERFYLCENKIVCQYDYEEHILPLEKSIVNRSDSEQVISISGFSNQIGPTKLHIDDHGLVNMDESNEEARSEEPSSSGRRQEKRDKDRMTSIDPDREPLEADTNPTDELDKWGDREQEPNKLKIPTLEP